MKQYEFMEVKGQDMENSLYRYPVSAEDLEPYGKEGWSIAYSINDGFTVMMQREINANA